jgi:acyl dehydratase
MFRVTEVTSSLSSIPQAREDVKMQTKPIMWRYRQSITQGGKANALRHDKSCPESV